MEDYAKQIREINDQIQGRLKDGGAKLLKAGEVEEQLNNLDK